VTPNAAKLHLLKLQNALRAQEEALQLKEAKLVSGSSRSFNLKTIQALDVLVRGVCVNPKKLSKKALKLLDVSGCSEIADDFVVLGQTDLRILLSDAAVDDLNAQAREIAELGK